MLLQIGQVWECIHPDDYNLGQRYTITEITENGKVFAVNPKYGRVYFAADVHMPLDKECWKLVSKGDSFRNSPGMEKCSPVSYVERNDFHFFSSVASGNCACNIPRHQCSYHS